MLRLAEGIQVYVAAERIDFRKAINGLAALDFKLMAEFPVVDFSLHF